MPLVRPADDAVFALLHLGHVDGDRRFADGDPPILRVLHDFQRVRMLEQRLGGNASPQQAGAAQGLLLLDDRDFEPQLGGADGGHIPAGAGADDHDVIFVWHSVISCKARPRAGSCVHRFSDDSGTNWVAPDCGAGSAGIPAGASASGSSRATRARNCP